MLGRVPGSVGLGRGRAGRRGGGAWCGVSRMGRVESAEGWVGEVSEVVRGEEELAGVEEEPVPLRSVLSWKGERLSIAVICASWARDRRAKKRVELLYRSSHVSTNTTTTSRRTTRCSS